MIKNYINYLLTLETKGIKLGLDRTLDLLKACNNPQKSLQSIQVVGTNGKGSTSAMIANILKCAGYKVGLYTSPHLNRINERIRINGIAISKKYIFEFVNAYHKNITEINSSFFEAVTALAVWYFKKKNVDIAILETGLGGRLDSVTCCESDLLVCTSISKDHQHILGDSIEKIAFEKISALKDNMICVSVNHNHMIKKVFSDYLKNKNVVLEYIDSKPEQNLFSKSALNGKHQLENQMLAIKAISHISNFTVKDSAIKKGLDSIVWPARIQKIQNKPCIYFDVAHNEDSFLSLCDFANMQKGYKTLILGIQKNKIIINIINILESTFDKIILTQTNTRNFYKPEQLQKYFNKKTTIIKNPNKAIQNAQHVNEDTNVFIAGSHYFGKYISKVFKISFDNI